MTMPPASANPFLATVIDRAYERVPLVEPRRASWFEAASAADAIDEDVPSRLPRAAAAPAAAAITPDVTAHTRAGNVAPLAVPAVALPRMTPTGAPEVRVTVKAEASREPRRADVSPPPLVPPAASAPEHAVVPPLAAAIAPARTAVPTLSPALTPRRAEPSVAPVLRETTLVKSTAAAQPERALLQSFTASLPLARNEAAAPVAAPQVTISIGRVEVRAAPAAATPVRTAAPARTAALADYLGRKERAR
jgi:hypothetical protein